LRLLQYLAAGVPAVASPVGTQARIVDCGGALPARTGAEWAVAIERLLKDTELRAQLAGIGRALVEKRYAPSAWFAKALAAWCGIQCTSGGLTSLGAKQKRTQSGTKEYRISNKEFPDS
jgi:glycosyltransferase involved in cell wall biosynthesis